MGNPTSDAFRLPLSRAFRAALAILLLTSVHHAYGACIYHTPWRLHVALVAALTALMLWSAVFVARNRPEGLASAIATVAFCLVDALIPVIGIGFFEGGYNHVLKNALYFADASPMLMTRLFPPPAYELPNDVLFEASGVMQFVVGMVAGYQLYGFIRQGWGACDGVPTGPAG
ncbi:hypothetical protein ACFPPA_00130 [Rhodanobacter ginsengisoli]|uniref:Uncharacterized protein n=1 Tax=Rhodanobacter ginsengisoli TaxID=418646 RepID=A0ABW0QN74_9GAMM